MDIEVVINDIKTVLLEKNVDFMVNFVIAMLQYVQHDNSWILQNSEVLKIYKLRKHFRQFEFQNLLNNADQTDIIQFFNKCEALNKFKVYKTDFIIKKITYILNFINRGFIIFPCNTNKTPRVMAWNHLTRNDVLQLYLTNDMEFTNIGLLCGEASGVVVIDIDKQNNGMEYWENLLKLNNNSNDIDTLITTTGSGGKHYFFKYSQNMSNWSSKNRIFMNENKKIGIDLRTKNGYVILPPSLHKKYNKLYEFNDINKTIIDMPEWLFNIINNLFVKLV